MVEVVELGPGEAWVVFDAVARREMGISGAVFLQRWDTGVYEGLCWDDVEGLVETWMVMRLVR